MAHQDGRCATDDETIYVQDTTGCIATFGGAGGTATQPFCSMEPVGLAANDTKRTVVVRGTVSGGSWTYQRGAGRPETSIIGQQSAVIASSTSPGFNMSSGLAYLRSLKVSPSASTGITATGGTLRVESVTIDSCQQGGILLDGAAFDIRKTTVTNNGPGNRGGFPWGGILVNTVPSSGPTDLNLVTIENNKQVGLTCTAQVSASGVFASGNSGGVEVSPTCGVTTCSPPGPTCGAP
jgi:hypothetical protein